MEYTKEEYFQKEFAPEQKKEPEGYVFHIKHLEDIDGFGLCTYKQCSPFFDSYDKVWAYAKEHNMIPARCYYSDYEIERSPVW